MKKLFVAVVSEVGRRLAGGRARRSAQRRALALLAIFLAAIAPLAAGRLHGQPPVKTNAAPDPNDPVEQEYRKIMIDDDEAVAEVDKWITEARAEEAKGNKAPSQTLSLRARARLSRVRSAYEDFLARHPSHARARIAFGSFLLDRGDEEEAVEQWEKARQTDPSIPAIWNDLANIYGHHGPIKKAFEYYGKAMELDPNESVYNWNLGMVIYTFRKDAREYYHLDEKQVFDRALELYRQAIKLDPTNFVLATDYAESFYGTKPPRWSDGLTAWEETIKKAQSDYEREGVWLHFARIKIKLGRLAEAQHDLDAVTNTMYLGLKHTLQRNLDEAKAKGTNAPPGGAVTPSVAK